MRVVAQSGSESTKRLSEREHAACVAAVRVRTRAGISFPQLIARPSVALRFPSTRVRHSSLSFPRDDPPRYSIRVMIATAFRSDEALYPEAVPPLGRAAAGDRRQPLRGDRRDVAHNWRKGVGRDK